MAIDFPTSPTTGQTVYLAGNAYTWDGTKWWTSTGRAAAVRQSFTAGAGQTSFTVTGGYYAGTIDVYKNGIKLVASAYTATDGTTITLSSGATAGDIIDVVSFNSFSIVNIDASAITSGTIPVTRGGTGASTLAANNVLLGNNGSTVQTVAPGTSGNVLTSNGTTWTSAAAPASGGFSNMQVFSASGTFTVPAGITKVKVTVVGGGGGGAYSGSTGGGGGAGGAAIKIVSGLTPGGTVAVTVGTGGAGGTSGSQAGSTGNSSSFAAYCSATGGAGAAAPSGVLALAGAGGIGSSGDLNIKGCGGVGGSDGPAFDSAGAGGSSILGGGGVATNGAGAAGGAYGGGGAGGYNSGGGGGGAGAAGVVIVEY